MAYGFKSGGRAAGTPNKRTSEAAQVVERLEAKLRAEGRLGPQESLDPIERLALAMVAADADAALKLAAAKELAKYLYPTRKAMEIADTTYAPEPPMSTAEAQEKILEALDRFEARKRREQAAGH